MVANPDTVLALAAATIQTPPTVLVSVANFESLASVFRDVAKGGDNGYDIKPFEVDNRRNLFERGEKMGARGELVSMIVDPIICEEYPRAVDYISALNERVERIVMPSIVIVFAEAADNFKALNDRSPHKIVWINQNRGHGELANLAVFALDSFY